MVIIEHRSVGGFVSSFPRVSQRSQQDAAQPAIAHPMSDETTDAGRKALDDRNYRASDRQADERFDGHRGR